MNILISGCGGGGTNPLLMEYYEMECFLRGARARYTFIGTDSNPYMVAHSVADKAYTVPRADAEESK